MSEKEETKISEDKGDKDKKEEETNDGDGEVYN